MRHSSKNCPPEADSSADAASTSTSTSNSSDDLHRTGALGYRPILTNVGDNDSTCLIMENDEALLTPDFVAQQHRPQFLAHTAALDVSFTENFLKALLKAREAFARNVTKSLKFRRNQLLSLRRCIDEHYEEFVGALHADFRKPRLETVVTEIEFVKNDIAYQLDNLSRYFKPMHVKRNMATMFDDCFVKYDPFGVVLIFSAWNYPVQVLLCPLVGAIAAGNCALIKPSEVASNTEQLFARLLPQYLDNDCYHVITGGPEEASRMLAERFDLVFFTGSSMVGRIVYNAAAKQLTPCVLELGGKSPVFIDESITDSYLEVAVKRILWAKLVNGGQTCIAPDYMMCTLSMQERFVTMAAKVLKQFYADDPKKSDSFSRIINTKNFDRLASMLSLTSGKVVLGGETDRDERYVAPTIVANVKANDSVMKDEIFGPIFPIMPVRDVSEAIEFVKRGEKPLTMYIFTKNNDVSKRFLEETSSGSVLVNDCLMQAALDTLPFGGVGNSGIGKYHGSFSFETFSHAKSVMMKGYNPVIEHLSACRYPPYNDNKIRKLKVFTARTMLDNIDLTKAFTYAFVFTLGAVSMFGLGWLGLNHF